MARDGELLLALDTGRFWPAKANAGGRLSENLPDVFRRTGALTDQPRVPSERCRTIGVGWERSLVGRAGVSRVVLS